MSLLRLDSLSASYGPVQALFDVSMSVAPGELVALMGRNGMGKTTTINTICKLLPVQSGQLVFEDIDLTQLPSHKVARLGIGLVPEGRRCFGNLSVDENLLCAARAGFWDLQQVRMLFPRLAERGVQQASQLSGGEQQMLAIGRALMTNPKLLILDEATEGLAPLVRQEIWSVIERLKRETGLAIIVVDKSLKELKRIAERVVVLERGASVWSGQTSELSDDVVRQYLRV